MNSKELKEEIEKLETEMKTLLSHDGFRQMIANMNFLQGAINAAKVILAKLEAKEKVEVQVTKEKVKEEADKALV